MLTFPVVGGAFIRPLEEGAALTPGLAAGVELTALIGTLLLHGQTAAQVSGSEPLLHIQLTFVIVLRKRLDSVTYDKFIL